MLSQSRTISVPDPFGTEVIAVPTGEPLTTTLRIESVLDGVLLSAAVSCTARGECVRCLDPVAEQVNATVQELYYYPDKAPEPGEEDDEPMLVQDELIDLEPVLRDAVVTALPFQPLCRPDCPGLCDRCGVRLAEHPGHFHDDIDPRWASLRGLLEGAVEHDPTPGPTVGNESRR